MLDAALALAAIGWHVLPTRRRKPTISDWPNRATAEPVQLREWWARWPDADPAVHAGGSGLVVLDIDGLPGWRSMPRLEELHGGPLPPTLKVRTGRGEHWYYRHPGRPSGNATALHGLEGIDIRADRGFVFAPGARHRDKQGNETGRTYTLVVRPRCPMGALKASVSIIPLAPACLLLDPDTRQGRHDKAAGAFADVFDGDK